MTDIRLTNTMTRSRETLVPITPGKVSMYVCGPTVYDRAHLGNARAAVVFDTLFRLLRHVYGAGNVRYVRNFTDVDDKINAEALRRQEAGVPGTLEELIHARSNETIGWYLDDMGAVGVMEPTEMPRATEYIPQMVAMIEELARRGFAYAAEGHVLFRVRAYDAYGRLSGRSVDDMIAGARVEVAPYKEDPMDFVLWKPSTDDLPGWSGPVIDGTPVGRGRPGWHIECSAMAAELLGERFDIHGGGNDLMFPHHENEIAQSRCMGHAFANIWMHNEMLQVEGKKMSKSLGNFFTVRDLLDKGYPGEVIRFVILSTHYRKPMDWTEDKAREARSTLRRWHALIEGAVPDVPVPAAVTAALADDLNTSQALTELRHIAGEGDAAALKAGANVLGLLQPELATWATRPSADQGVASLIEQLLQERATARAARNFARADALRDGFEAAGVVVRDTGSGVHWELGPAFDAAKLEALK